MDSAGNEEPMRSGENFDISAEVFRGVRARLSDRAASLSHAVDAYRRVGRIPYLRVIQSAASREVDVEDSQTGESRAMLMFGSNNYLGLASHPYIKQEVIKAISKWGTGIGGPPFLNGYLSQSRALEERLADFKGKQACMLFSSGFSANLALGSSLFQRRDAVFYDEYSHASFFDGLKLARLRAKRFKHNDLTALRTALGEAKGEPDADTYVAVEGVYSMDGDLAPLDKIVEICRDAGALTVIDDAHGSGVLGANGRGTAEHFGVEGAIDIVMGTFSKTLAVNGGFLCASSDIIEYARWLSRPYMFSAALPPSTIAAVSAGLDVIEREPERRDQLWNNIRYAVSSINSLSWDLKVSTQSAILILPAPQSMNVRRANGVFSDEGIFLNPVEFPAVPKDNQRFRISLMAIHTVSDIDRLVAAIDKVWTLWSDGALGDDGKGAPWE